jgi:hypothetical protein
MAATVALHSSDRQVSFHASLRRTLYIRLEWTGGTIWAIEVLRSRLTDSVSGHKTRLVTLAAMIVIVAVASWVIVSRTDNPRFLTVTPRGNFTLGKAERFAEFPVYSVGLSFRGLPLHAVNRVKGNRPATDPARHNSLSFGYGTCDIPLWRGKADGGCGLPLDIQNWPACERTIAVGGGQVIDELVTIRGVPALFSEGYRKLSLTTGSTTIFLSGAGRSFLLEAARSLRGVNNPVGTTGKLPKPAQGALEGSFECSPKT